ncbi:LysR substrate-binding domain-containing protein [Sphingomonas sp. MG17]|jgi:LysR family nitrogen assimilation transcriptional regulator|uniref:LysR substrate-binding domain-containing protein n=1 Tax=Sphingomonas tagetis TaxID=2949092 RepID=A0A9X2HUR6_9SPHN|nr:LysR substrate-binding domain-containing protein [Sphingomonas tagetis]MCP3733010.1 LysR substrate-binding domain-containing protein [Sphingomonas tagetis]
MDSKRLRGLVAIAEHGNFGRAATAMGLSQPSLSRQIALLEAEIASPLLYRNGRGASLTAEGQRLVDAARPLIWALDALPSAINDTEPQGQVVLGMPTFLSAHLAEPLFGALRARFPRLHVKLVDGFSGFVSQWLLEGRLDIAVIYAARRSPAISAEPLADEELFLFASRKLADQAVEAGILPAAGSAPIEAISRLDIILPGREHGLRRALQRAGARPDPARLLEVESLAAIRALVRHEAGWSILPRAGLTAGDNAELAMWPLGDPSMRVRLMLAFGANRPITPALRAVTSFLKAEVAQLQHRQVMSQPLAR